MFVLEHLVIKSLDDINVLHWKTYFLNNLDVLIGEIQQRRVLILSGVHDNLSVEPRFYEEDLGMIDWLKNSPHCSKRADIDRLQVRKFPHFLCFLHHHQYFILLYQHT